MASDYTRGKMDIAAQTGTFNGFMTATLWSCLILAVSLFYLTLVFAVGTDWMASLIGVGILGIVLGLLTSMKMSWYVTLAGLFVFSLICGGLSQLFGVFLAGN